MARINPATFIHPFRYETASKTANTSGGQGEQFGTYINARGSWEQVSGSSDFDTAKHRIVNVYRVITFWRSALESIVDKSTKLIYDNRVFRIDNIERIGEHRQYYQFTVSTAN